MNNLDTWIDEIIEDAPFYAWCPECEHPVCISSRKSLKQKLLSKFKEVERDSRIDELTLVTEKFGSSIIQLRAYKADRLNTLRSKKL